MTSHNPGEQYSPMGNDAFCQYSDLVTLNILTKYFITIRYNLNKILLS